MTAFVKEEDEYLGDKEDSASKETLEAEKNLVPKILESREELAKTKLALEVLASQEERVIEILDNAMP